MEIYVRKIGDEIGDEYFILTSPDGRYPSGGYFKNPTGCESLAELTDKLECEGKKDFELIGI